MNLEELGKKSQSNHNSSVSKIPITVSKVIQFIKLKKNGEKVKGSISVGRDRWINFERVCMNSSRHIVDSLKTLGL